MEKEKIEILLELINESEKDIKDGNIIPQEEVFEELEKMFIEYKEDK